MGELASSLATATDRTLQLFSSCLSSWLCAEGMVSWFVAAAVVLLQQLWFEAAMGLIVLVCSGVRLFECMLPTARQISWSSSCSFCCRSEGPMFAFWPWLKSTQLENIAVHCAGAAWDPRL